MSLFVPEKLLAVPNGRKALIDRLDGMIADCELATVTALGNWLQQEAALAAMVAEANRIKSAIPAAAKE